MSVKNCLLYSGAKYYGTKNQSTEHYVNAEQSLEWRRYESLDYITLAEEKVYEECF